MSLWQEVGILTCPYGKTYLHITPLQNDEEKSTCITDSNYAPAQKAMI